MVSLRIAMEVGAPTDMVSTEINFHQRRVGGDGVSENLQGVDVRLDNFDARQIHGFYRLTLANAYADHST